MYQSSDRENHSRLAYKRRGFLELAKYDCFSEACHMVSTARIGPMTLRVRNILPGISLLTHPNEQMYDNTDHEYT